MCVCFGVVLLGESERILRIKAREVVGMGLILGLEALIRSLDFPAFSGGRICVESFHPRREAS